LGRIILVTGGSRSGKSEYARYRAESLAGPRAFIATCPKVDEEMDERIRRHQEERARAQWHTIEETTDLTDAIRQNHKYNVFLVDCLTLWINNLMYDADQSGKRLSEDQAASECRSVLEACSSCAASIFFVTNEVGLGIVPSDPISRRYRDLVGRCNQIVAQAADEVILVVCGLPVVVKVSQGQ
jgi:adenosylcobinamide kinase / adenosylcobinamide-phosphate guanylyltransferase